VKLLLDQGLPRSAASILRQKQIEATHVGELDMASASDQRIIDYARENSFSIVTLDADFHALLAVARAAGPSVIRIRVQPLKRSKRCPSFCLSWSDSGKKYARAVL
jgi:predicted nuclease of predicted toxin-antitoxin system